MNVALPRSRILGTGSHAPSRVVTNDELARGLDTSDAWITDRTGIHRRHIAGPGETASQLAAVASRAALAAAGLGAMDVGMIVVATFTADRRLPSCATELGALLGADAVPAFDLSAACAGFVYALSVADQFIATGALDCVLVVGVEILSCVTDWKDRGTAVLFGDGAGAVVLGRAERDGRGLLATRLYTDGSAAEALLIPMGGSAEPVTVEGLARSRDAIKMDGADVFRIAVRNMTAASTEAVKSAGLTMAEVDWVVPHQANRRILTQVASRIGLPLEKFVMNLDEYGNTSSASIPLALDEAVRDGRIRPGDRVLFCALGAGISWGASVVRM
jgi:3-oxoacyl-[acyl-carrier-protein] synthase-3